MIPPFPPLPELPGGCPRCEHCYGLSSSSPGFWSHHHQPVLFQTRVLAGISQSGSPGQTAMKLLGFRLQQTQPTPPWKSMAIVSVHSRTKRPEQSRGTQLPGLGRKTVPLPLVMGRGQQARSQWEPVAKPKVKRPLRACPPHPHRRSQLPSLSCS